IEARVHVADGEWSKAAEVQRTLWDLAPENLDYGLALVIDQSFGGQAQKASTTLAEVRRRAGARASDPMIDLREAVVAEALQDWERELAAANRTYEGAKQRGERALLPEAAYYRGGAYIGMGKNREAIAALEEARRDYEELGDRGGVGYIL